MQVFMVSHSAQLSAAALRSILGSGHSRVPVYKGSRQQVVGLLLVKELLLLDPEEEVGAVQGFVRG